MAIFNQGDIVITSYSNIWHPHYQNQLGIVISKNKYNSIVVKFMFNNITETYKNDPYSLAEQFIIIGKINPDNKLLRLVFNGII